MREAGNGDWAFAMTVEDPAAYALLVTDIHMPGSLDGIGVARLLRVRRPDLPVIYTKGMPGLLNALQPLGAREVLLRKPFALSDMLGAVRRLLGQSDTRVC